MRRTVFIALILGFFLFLTSLTFSQDKVVVIPLFGDEATGNATADEVLKGKTFSNSSATNLTGRRPPAPVEKTGQTGSNGIPWPIPRFTAGTYVVTDNLTGLMWTKSASNGEKDWNSAIDYCNGLMIYEPAGAFTILYDDWRLPNIKELQSLIDFSNSDPALPSGHPFTGVELHDYWSSTTYSDYYSLSWIMNFAKGLVNSRLKDTIHIIWAVRGGQ